MLLEGDVVAPVLDDLNFQLVNRLLHVLHVLAQGRVLLFKLRVLLSERSQFRFSSWNEIILKLTSVKILINI